MIRHMVLLRGLADPAPIMADLDALCDALPGIARFGHGPNVTQETDSVHGWDYAFWVDFAYPGAHAGYLADPLHAAIGERLLAGVGGGENLLVCDVEM